MEKYDCFRLLRSRGKKQEEKKMFLNFKKHNQPYKNLKRDTKYPEIKVPAESADQTKRHLQNENSW